MGSVEPVSSNGIAHDLSKLDVSETTVHPILTPYKSKAFDLDIRVVYAPLTRCRAVGFVPQPAAALYYSQRAHHKALLISEGTSPSPTGHGYPQTPGIYTPEQIEAWKPITKAVKEKGAIFFCQLWHVGRASHNAYQPGGAAPLAPSALAIQGAHVMLPDFTLADYPVPQAVTKEQIQILIQEFAQAAKNAIDAGFDGVEIHGANAYLLDEFLKDGSNKRTDEYGGCIENRARFQIEVTKAVIEAIGAERVGYRLSPYGTFLDCIDSNPIPGTRYLVEQLSKLGIAYVHMVEGRANGSTDCEPSPDQTLTPYREVFEGTFIAAGGFTRDLGNKDVVSGAADLVAFGRYFLSTPDLPERFANGAPLNKYDRDTFFTPGQVEGYTDYPFLDEINQELAPVVEHRGEKVFDIPFAREKEANPIKFYYEK
eukprot:jgi/Botrbrau1/11687/Bobra.0195s0018.1